MDILGNSQTFIGVLTTIVVLCVVTESGNFIYKLFEGIIKNTEEEIQGIEDKVSEKVIAIQKYWESYELTTLIQKAGSFKQITEERKSEILTEQMMFKLKTSQYTLSFSDKYFLPIYERIELIKTSKEQTFSPLMIFAYCLIVFGCDEIGRWFQSLSSLMVSFLSLFTFFIFTYLLIVWLKFYRESHLPLDEKNSDGNTSQGNKAPDFSMPSFFKVFGFCSIIFILTLLIIRLIIPDPQEMLYASIYRVVILLAIILPVGFFARRHTRIRQANGQYRHSFILSHFLGLFFLSAFYSLLLIWPVLTPQTILMPYSSDLWLLKSGMILTITLNGIIFPFLFPYLGNRYILFQTKENSDKFISNAEHAYDELKEWTQRTKAEINEIISKNSIKRMEEEDNIIRRILNKLKGKKK